MVIVSRFCVKSLTSFKFMRSIGRMRPDTFFLGLRILSFFQPVRAIAGASLLGFNFLFFYCFTDFLDGFSSFMTYFIHTFHGFLLQILYLLLETF